MAGTWAAQVLTLYRLTHLGCLQHKRLVLTDIVRADRAAALVYSECVEVRWDMTLANVLGEWGA